MRLGIEQLLAQVLGLDEAAVAICREHADELASLLEVNRVVTIEGIQVS